MQRVLFIILLALMLTGLYAAWTHTTVEGNILILFIAALVISALFTTRKRFIPLEPKRIAYAIAYIPYMFYAIIRANFDVARRVVQPTIPINPGIVEVRTKLKSSIGKTVLANSITLTPGTLSVDIRGNRLFIHWIDVRDVEEKGATEDIVRGFERFLEVIFG
ncbi:MAG: hypothetical protein B6D63_05150 [Candidatus Latescibacteria bacterium 4484_7]|nr:MAG: hypothetical protein B6D63_05150 [Candidatus Latescibacteria bacterium 4484_7]